jgi:arsenite/tail-anchored protein-transporting ATPase
VCVLDRFASSYNLFVPELAFFIGKGGVGKTTISAAYAVQSAAQSSHSRVLLVSTDPAHSLGDVLQTKVGPSRSPRLLKRPSRLSAWEIDSDKLFRNFLNEHRQELVQIIERGSLFTAADISSLLETALPGMAEIAALLAIQQAIESGKYSHIVVDTAPFGHTLRLFGLPQQFEHLLNFLELSADRDRVLAQHFGGSNKKRGADFIEEWRSVMYALDNAFAAARIFLVTTAERFALNESVRCLRELRNSNPDVALDTVVLNRVVLKSGPCANCHKRVQSVKAARATVKQEFKSAELLIAEDPGWPILGIPALGKFGAHVFLGKALKLSAQPVGKTPRIQLTRASWPPLSTSATFVLGKGGVGKTTVSAGIGFNSRARSADSVEICSVDPAPSLDDIFEKTIDDRPTSVLGDAKFRASELDSPAMFQQWIGEIREQVDSATTAEYSGVHVDLSYERKLFPELLEIVPAGLDEVMAIFRIAEMIGPGRKVIIDMAPTGHALELLRMPERILSWARLLLKSLAAHRKLALAREAAVKVAELEVRARELTSLMKGSRQTRIFAVMLPEPLPDRETARLLEELNCLRLPTAAVFVNRVLLRENANDCVRCSRIMQWQASILAGLKRRLRGKQIYVIPNFDHELAGKPGLQELTNELWRLN